MKAGKRYCVSELLAKNWPHMLSGANVQVKVELVYMNPAPANPAIARSKPASVIVARGTVIMDCACILVLPYIESGDDCGVNTSKLEYFLDVLYRGSQDEPLAIQFEMLLCRSGAAVVAPYIPFAR